MKKHKTRRGWMRSKRTTMLTVSLALFRGISTPGQQAACMNRRREIPDHILMALGVVNHLVETYLEHFPKEPPP